MFAIAFPAIDPVAIAIGPLAIRWYALAYIVGLVLGWRYVRRLSARPPHALSVEEADDFLFWATIGVVIGGRLGYVLFYNFGYYIDDPLRIFKLWEGGMSFHGGAAGVLVAVVLYARAKKIDMLAVGDVVAAAAPIGLFFGRMANFINGELYGRVSDVPWAVIFPGDRQGLPRHPSQLYEALLEGVVLFVVLYLLARRDRIRLRPGVLSGTFLAGYGLARFVVEFFRQPDIQIGFLAGGSTMGQLLSLPMILIGALLIVYGLRRTPVSPRVLPEKEAA